jgi:hypothetical protein
MRYERRSQESIAHLEIPPGRPVLFWNFAGSGRKPLERIDQCCLLVQRNCFHEVGNLGAPSLGYLVHQFSPPYCQGESNQAPIATLVSPHYQILLNEAIAHARGGRRRDVHCLGKFGEALWTTGCKDDESSVLGEGYFFSDVTE